MTANLYGFQWIASPPDPINMYNHLLPTACQSQPTASCDGSVTDWTETGRYVRCQYARQRHDGGGQCSCGAA